MHFFAFGIVSVESESLTEPSAFASCWISEGIEVLAEARAKRMIEDYGWRVVSTVESHPIAREDYAEGDSGLDYFDQAEIDGEVAVLFVPKQS